MVSLSELLAGLSGKGKACMVSAFELLAGLSGKRVVCMVGPFELAVSRAVPYMVNP